MVNEVAHVKSLSKNDVLRITGVSGKQYKTVRWHDAQIVIKPILDMRSFIDTVRLILAECTAPDGSISKELIDFSTRVHIIAAYSFVEMPDDLDQVYYIVYQSDLYDMILKTANSAQINAIIRTVQSFIGG